MSNKDIFDFFVVQKKELRIKRYKRGRLAPYWVQYVADIFGIWFVIAEDHEVKKAKAKLIEQIKDFLIFADLLEYTEEQILKGRKNVQERIQDEKTDEFVSDWEGIREASKKILSR